MTALDFLDAHQGVRTFVTGHTGFKGTWLTTWLDRVGAEVTGLALEPEAGQDSLFSRSRIETRIDSRIGDIREMETVHSVLSEAQPSIVYHLAAQALVRRSYRDPITTFDTNVMGTLNVLEACRHTPNVKAIVVITSDKAYANPETGTPLAEDSPMGGHDPYSASKGAAEVATSAYRDSFFSNADTALLSSARAGNVIGPGDDAEDRLLPDIVRSLSAGEPVIIRSPNSTRPWQHVLEPLRGYLMLGHKLLTGDRSFAEGWNFGPPPGDITPVLDVAERAVNVWGSGTIEVDEPKDAPHEAQTLALDISKAQRRLSFTPALDIAQAVNLTIDGYHRLHDGTMASEVLSDQIAHYESLLAT